MYGSRGNTPSIGYTHIYRYRATAQGIGYLLDEKLPPLPIGYSRGGLTLDIQEYTGSIWY